MPNFKPGGSGPEAGMRVVGVARAKRQCHDPTITLITLANKSKSKDLSRPFQISTGQPWVRLGYDLGKGAFRPQVLKIDRGFSTVFVLGVIESERQSAAPRAIYRVSKAALTAYPVSRERLWGVW